MFHLVLSRLSRAAVLSAAALFDLSALMAAQSPLVPVSMEVHRYDEVLAASRSNRASCCAPRIYASGSDFDFIHVRVVFNLAFSDMLDRVSVHSSDIVRVTPEVPEGLDSFGYDRLRGAFEDAVTPLSAHIARATGRPLQSRPRSIRSGRCPRPQHPPPSGLEKATRRWRSA
ncbi:hypothetical protein C7455_104171 [Roseicyclus mahoneyensis]|uniref:Uncharacterized protein n=1 Tax=Roseicyclus mahoneyensis TaxID=164332 RepID=A0A316GIW1_9RHOB|nr:hypothetical protein C7455_104171 [Roseicyclus mahoneyensis]